MEDADVYAYEQELAEMDEWEAMHEHEMEAAEEEMRAMEEAERRLASSAPAEATTASSEPLREDGSEETDEDDGLSRAQQRLNQVLARCSTLLGEDDEPMEDDAPPDALLSRKDLPAPAVDTTTAKYLHARPPIDVASMAVVLSDGQRMFLRKKSAAAEDPGAVSKRRKADVSTLVPIQKLMEKLQMRKIAANIASEADEEMEIEKAAHPETAPKSTQLWLDKYRPTAFIDLLSDERTNREVLAWIKRWDPYVFPNKKHVEVPAPYSRQRFSPRSKQPSNGIFKGPGNKQQNPQDPSSDEPEDKRPHEKIILICGPPGAGKTTLANIVARHAGYNPIEVNASDDRTADVLKNKIISAMEMQSIFGSQKPNCIILDEIDGAMNGGDGRTAIAAIQEIVTAPLKAKKDGKSAGNSRKNRHPLIRPLICICNDQFASVLRPLRQLAKIFVLDTPNPQRLITRLKFICREEGLQRSTGALATLCSNGENDIRYCVNALQFQSMQPGRNSSSPTSSGKGQPLLVGQKDQTRGVTDTMNLVFYQPRSKTSITPTPASEVVAEAAFGMGNAPLLINALDENLPSMIFNDPTMNKLCDAFEWLGLADAWDTKVRSDQQFALASYVPFAAVAVHHACCTSSRRRIAYPRLHFDAQKKLERAHNIVQSLLEASQLHPSMRVGPGVLVVDVIPSLLGILSPNIRRVNPSLQTKEEKLMVRRLIDVMASLGLSFRPKYMSDGSEDFALEPALHELMLFKHSEDGQVFRTMLPPLVRKMITREVELEQMRRSENGGRPVDPAASDSKAASVDSKVEVDTKPGEKKPKAFVLPELTEAQEAAKIEAMRRRNPFAFAHREAKRKREELAREQKRLAQPDTASDGAPRPRVRYKFNEGYTSGIKTTVYMRDLV